MNFIDIAKARYSVRNYKPVEIEENKLSMVLEAFRIAPSAVNFQPWHLIVIQSIQNKVKVYEAYQREWLKSAPILIVACGDHSISWKRSDGKDHLDIDISIAVDHLTLQATELGLGTCWVCNFNPVILKRNLNLPENIEPIVIIPLGYPADQADSDRHILKRKPLNEFVHIESFNK
jgi:nitroreductase